jgi:hypothetical protein
METAVPLVVTTVIAGALGLVTTQVLVGGRVGVWRWPDAVTLAIIGAGIITAFAVSMLVLPLLNVATRHEAVRFE